MDFLTSIGHELGRDANAPAGAEATNMTEQAASNADDISNLCSGNDTVEKLKMRLHALPDIRQQRVDALKQAISDGTYKISPLVVATAMLSEPDLG